MASTFIPGLRPQNPHYIPGYTGHCPLLQFSMGQTYGKVTGQLLRGPPGIAWPPAHRMLLPPIWPLRSPELPRKGLPPRHGHQRLSSSMIPGYTGFVPQAQFIFAKNCSQVWAEALNDFTQQHGWQGSQEPPEEDKEGKDTEEHREPEAEETEQRQEVSPYSMDDTDPRKFFMSVSPFPQASLATCPVRASSLAPPSQCLPIKHCRNLGKIILGTGPRRSPQLSPRFLEPTFRTRVFCPTMEAMCQGISSSLATHLGISPRMPWASTALRSSSWLRYLDFKFFLCLFVLCW
ncbi:ciliary microtubule inner protein 2B isoform 2-T2 [Thomomys bottae]